MHDRVAAANSHFVAGHPNRVQDWCLSIDEQKDLN
jgi:hypothetical protein